VGLADIPHRPARVLSGGEQQRVALGRAWALEPDVLFLDEPTANLDPTATKQVEDIVQSIHAAGTKIVMTTHNLGQARRMGDEIVLLAHGRLIEHTPADAFFRTPSSPEGAAFVQGELPW
jgi:tungstate transport system ATP-binding protein